MNGQEALDLPWRVLYELQAISFRFSYVGDRLQVRTNLLRRIVRERSFKDKQKLFCEDS
jgi:hypothetical protein